MAVRNNGSDAQKFESTRYWRIRCIKMKSFSIHIEKLRHRALPRASSNKRKGRGSFCQEPGRSFPALS